MQIMEQLQQQSAFEVKPRRIATPNFQHLVEVCQVVGADGSPPAFNVIHEAPQSEEKDIFEATFGFLTASRPIVSSD